MQLLKNLANDKDVHSRRSILLVLHNINHAATCADRIITIKNAKVIAYDKIEKLINSETLEDIFDYSMPVIQHQ